MISWMFRGREQSIKKKISELLADKKFMIKFAADLSDSGPIKRRGILTMHKAACRNQQIKRIK